MINLLFKLGARYKYNYDSYNCDILVQMPLKADTQEFAMTRININPKF